MRYVYVNHQSEAYHIIFVCHTYNDIPYLYLQYLCFCGAMISCDRSPGAKLREVALVSKINVCRASQGGADVGDLTMDVMGVMACHGFNLKQQLQLEVQQIKAMRKQCKKRRAFEDFFLDPWHPWFWVNTQHC